MKKLELFYVYDTINECAITSVIPQNNLLTAALGFRDAYIKNKKSPYNYQQLELVNFGWLDVDVNTGELHQGCNVTAETRLSGKEVMNYIADELKKRGIDDVFDEEEVE